MAQHLPQMKTFGWGDPRALSEAGLRSLLVHATAFQTLHVQEILLRLVNTPERLASKLPDYFYATDLLTAEGRSALVTQWTALFRHHADAGGLSTIEFPLTLFRATR